MVISGKSLRTQCSNIVAPFVERTQHESGFSFGLGPASYDIRIRDDLTLFTKEFALADALETFEIPKNVVAVVHDKSTWARLGLTVQNTVIDPGFRGHLRLELTNHSDKTITIKAGTPIAQVLFHATDIPCDPYDGKYQDQGPGQNAILNSR